MRIYCCQNHVGQGLDEFVAKTESYPILTELSESEKLSTKCDYCEEPGLYLVADK
ncbi:CxxH/CxxC protein [Planococcus sp. ISL-109]|uniref:CxxH/CxxC protein n=1 Tax=Planococcus sp. ISL-109 TaxID=2819166 RepID=UPI001BE97370|nr:CxxH/CxxC protein [Planococcus sp. ISL-109]MBT2584207.1 CxxH/CxxC protein [Planococcus sp. ISL-109]